jgi:Ca2+-transporting ATPase
VLLDDNFASIVTTVRQGRHILQNIQRAFLYLIRVSYSDRGTGGVEPVDGNSLVLLPIHLVWLELIVHPVSALVFQAEPASDSVMKRPPRNPAAALLQRDAITRSALSGALLALASFATFWWQWQSVGEPNARALALIVLFAVIKRSSLQSDLRCPRCRSNAFREHERSGLYGGLRLLAWC